MLCLKFQNRYSQPKHVFSLYTSVQKWTEVDQNESKWSKWTEVNTNGLNGTKWTEWTKQNRMDKIGPNETRRTKQYESEMNRIEWTNVDRVGINRTEQDHSGPNRTKVGRMDQRGPHRTDVDQIILLNIYHFYCIFRAQIFNT